MRADSYVQGVRRHLPLLSFDKSRLRQEEAKVRRHLFLLSLDWTRDKDPRVPLGHASLVASIRARDAADVTYLSLPINLPSFDLEQALLPMLRLAEQVPANRLDIGIGVYVWNEIHVCLLIKALRERGFTGRIVLGGPQISYCGPDLEQRYPQADVFIRGYAEEALVDLIESGGRAYIVGVHFAGEKDRQEQARPSLSLLPSPFLDRTIDVSGQRFVRWETQRGCPFRCSFCQHREAGRRLTQAERALGGGRLREEIALFVENDVKDIAVLDPIFNAGREHLEILSEFHRLGYRGRLSLQCRFESIGGPFLDACQHLDVRLEFGLQTIHDDEGRAIRRTNDMERVEQVIGELNRRGLYHEVSLIFGLPKQTLSSFCETVEYCLNRRVPTIRAFPLMLLRGTELEARREEFGLLENEDPIPAVVRSHSFDEEEWREMAAIAACLDRTAGRHPQDLAGLWECGYDSVAPRPGRYSPPRPMIGAAAP